MMKISSVSYILSSLFTQVQQDVLSKCLLHFRTTESSRAIPVILCFPVASITAKPTVGNITVRLCLSIPHHASAMIYTEPSGSPRAILDQSRISRS